MTLVPATEELASLCARERDARHDVEEAGQKLINVLERKHQDDDAAWKLREEQDELL